MSTMRWQTSSGNSLCPCDEAAYDLSIDYYQSPPPPPLSEEQRWLEDRLAIVRGQAK